MLCSSFLVLLISLCKQLNKEMITEGVIKENWSSWRTFYWVNLNIKKGSWQERRKKQWKNSYVINLGNRFGWRVCSDGEIYLFIYLKKIKKKRCHYFLPVDFAASTVIFVFCPLASKVHLLQIYCTSSKINISIFLFSFVL